MRDWPKDRAFARSREHHAERDLARAQIVGARVAELEHTRQHNVAGPKGAVDLDGRGSIDWPHVLAANEAGARIGQRIVADAQYFDAREPRVDSQHSARDHVADCRQSIFALLASSGRTDRILPFSAPEEGTVQ